ncbi:MAG: phosphoenolpyruvate synthase [Muribaculaceae bacterium]|nr:phosphoenolpyruvate synthase [Muribaculaceae bacterium]
MNEEALSQLYLKETAFQKLMQRRIFNVLLIASPYDAFMMEEDGRVEEQLYFEYVSLNLSSPPRVTRVSSSAEAIQAMKSAHFDLVITMPSMDISETFSGAAAIKAVDPNIPVVVLTPFSKEVSRRLENEDFTHVDYVFSWLGNMDLLLAIIKLIEDKMNADDITDVGVQMLLLVEDSVRFYSSILPTVYKFLLKQSMVFSTEALNEHEQRLRMRGRPKVMLARDYEEAVALFEKYKDNMLGVISDVSFKRNGEKDSQAGLQLARYIRSRSPYMPIIIESSDIENADRVHDFNGVFLDKNSKKLPVDMGEAIMGNFGFGDFIVRNPETGEEIMRLKDLKDMQKNIFAIPDEALFHHASTNDISRWFYSRALFPIAEVIKQHRFRSLDEAPAVKQLFFDLIVKYRKMKNRGVVAVFRKDRFDHYSNFARIGDGSLGGKGRGLAFVDSIIKKNPICDNFSGVTISIPRTVVLCTDIFDEFMATNGLYPMALSDASDDDILKAFLAAKLPSRLIDDFYALFEVVDRPLAIRSSSLLEDSHYQPFAGIYSTYMIPYDADPDERLRMLVESIKGVYASVFYQASKAYMSATSNVIDQEKMAVIIQEVVGESHGPYYFPSFSGVGRSLNYYPIGEERTQDGVAEIAIGLGKYIVDGGLSLRFSPIHPDKVLQTSTLDLALRDTQNELYVLGPNDTSLEMSADDGFNIVKKSVRDFAGTGALRYLVSTFDPQNGILMDYDAPGRGRKVVTFANVLRDKVFPLAPAVDFMLRQGQTEMQRPVEIEFAGNINPQPSPEGIKGHIYWLQIRPIIDKKENVDEAALNANDEDLILRSNTALGHGNIDGISTIIYVKPENFDSLKNTDVARELHTINREMAERGEGYILIGPGRWGSSDPALGIPVKWPDISASRLIVESSLNNYRIEPSQGTHFFHNLTSFGVGYFTINPHSEDGIYNLDYLNSMPAVYESERLRVVKFDNPLTVAIDGRKGAGVVFRHDRGPATVKDVDTDISDQSSHIE